MLKSRRVVGRKRSGCSAKALKVKGAMRYGYVSIEGWIALAFWLVLVMCFVSTGGKPPRKELEPVIGFFALGALILTRRWAKNRAWLARTKLRSQAWYDGRNETRQRRQRFGRVLKSRSKALDWAGWFHWRHGQPIFARGKHADHLLRDVAQNDRSYLEWMMRQDLPADTESIVRSALEGKFPCRK